MALRFLRSKPTEKPYSVMTGGDIVRSSNGYGIGSHEWKRVAFGIAVGILTMLAVAGAFAWLVHSEVIGREHLGLASAIVLAMGSLLGAVSAGGGEGRLLRCATVGGGIILFLLVLNLLLFDGALGGLLPGALVIVGSTAAAALITGNRSRKVGRKYRYRKYSNR